MVDEEKIDEQDEEKTAKYTGDSKSEKRRLYMISREMETFLDEIPVTGVQLADELGVSEQTISRDRQDPIYSLALWEAIMDMAKSSTLLTAFGNITRTIKMEKKIGSSGLSFKFFELITKLYKDVNKEPPEGGELDEFFDRLRNV